MRFDPEPIRLLLRTPPTVEYGRPARDGEDEAAAEESAYTSSLWLAINDAGEAVDEPTQKWFTAQAHDDRQTQAMINKRRREQYELDVRLRRIREDAQRQGVNLRQIERVIAYQVRKAEQRLYEGRAA